VPYFGAARLIAAEVGKVLKGLRWVGIPFCGSMPEVFCIDAPTVVVNDRYHLVINLARMLGHPVLGPQLYRRLKRTLFHPESLAAAQAACRNSASSLSDLDLAYNYFVSQWMGRSAKAGTKNELTGALPVRWNGGGGDSNTRYRSAVSSIVSWRRLMAACNFTCMDAFDFLAKCKDDKTVGIYVDPPWPDAGDEYKYRFTPAEHERLAAILTAYTKSRVVCRFYGDHPLVAKLYPKREWLWQWLDGRKQTNEIGREVLLIRNGH
jgi:site-specific DNA-adenine methylase